MIAELSDGTVTLLPLRPEHVSSMYAAVVESVAEVSPWLPWCHAGYTLADSSRFIELAGVAYADDTQFQFGILGSISGEFLGVISINHVAKTNRLANVGYWVRSTRTRQGIGSRAVRLVAKFAFEQLGLTRLEIVCIPGNAASRRVAEKAGAKLEAISRNRLVMHGRSYDAALYALIPDDIAAATVELPVKRVALRMVGTTEIREKHRASCHCGSVVLEIDLPDGIVDPHRCDCSICRRKGALVAAVPLSGLRVVEGGEVLKTYQFNTLTAKHFFCSKCGIYTHHQRRSNPDQYGYNIGCLEDVNPADLADIPTHDGVNHPSDRRA